MRRKILGSHKKIAMLLSLFIITSSLSSLPTASAADGDLDTTFGTGGKVITNFGADDRIFSSVLQSDGKIIVAGSSNNNFAVARYNTNGDLDTSFDTDGLDPIDFGSTDSAEAAAIQSDGKIVVAGTSGNDFALARLNTDGSLDTSFGTNGKVITDLGSAFEAAYALAIQSDGRIIVAGKSNHGVDDDFALARYNTDGTLDTSFDTDGKLRTDFGSYEEIQSVAIQSDGKIVAAGRSGNLSPDFAVARYNTDGTLDASFNGDGKVTVDFNFDQADANSVSIQSDGKIVIGGSVNATGSDSDFGILRLTSAGELDSTFDNDGKVTTNISNTDVISTVLILGNGKILAAGYSIGATNYNFTLTRYNTSGSLDTSFGTNGIVTTSMSAADLYAMSALIQSDGNIVVSGYALTTPTNEFFVARYTDSSAANAEAARIAAANAEAARIAAANAEAARIAAANAEAARVAAANAEAARKAKEQKELLEILSIIPEIGKLALSVGDTALAVSGQKCVKNKTIKYVKKGAKCPKGYVKKK